MANRRMALREGLVPLCCPMATSLIPYTTLAPKPPFPIKSDTFPTNLQSAAGEGTCLQTRTPLTATFAHGANVKRFTLIAGIVEGVVFGEVFFQPGNLLLGGDFAQHVGARGIAPEDLPVAVGQ